MEILLKEATFITPDQADYHLKTFDVLIKEGVVVQIEKQLPDHTEGEVIRKENLHISKGWMDTGVAFGEPGYEHRETFENGMKVAAKSGFTDIFWMPNVTPMPNEGAGLGIVKEKVKEEVTSLHPIGSLTHNQKGEILAELYDLLRSGAKGFYDYKRGILNSNLLKIALEYTHTFESRIWSFPMDPNLRHSGQVLETETTTALGLKNIPPIAEIIQVARDLAILKYTGGKLHIPTISNPLSVALIAKAKEEGLEVSCSIALANLILADNCLNSFDSNFKVMPPLQPETQLNPLRTAVANGDIDFVTSDHCPRDVEEKVKEFDQALFGTIGLENMYGLLNKEFGTEKTVQILTRNKELFGLESYPIKVGEKANITLFNPEGNYLFVEKNITSTSKNCAFLNLEHKGRVYGIINGNKQLISHG